MKARVKGTEEIVEVFWSDQYEDWLDRNTGGHYCGSVLEFIDNDSTDWQAYRLEVAKECMAQLITYSDGRDMTYDYQICSERAVQATDALIARLKEQKGK